jgi:hypothetical protein
MIKIFFELLGIFELFFIINCKINHSKIHSYEKVILGELEKYM